MRWTVKGCCESSWSRRSLRQTTSTCRPRAVRAAAMRGEILAVKILDAQGFAVQIALQSGDPETRTQAGLSLILDTLGITHEVAVGAAYSRNPLRFALTSAQPTVGCASL